MGCSSSVVLSCIYFSLAGIGASACWSPVIGMVQRSVKERYTTLAIVFVDIGNASGIIISSSVLPLIISHNGWRTGWYSLGFLAFFMAAISIFGLSKHSFESRIREIRGPMKESWTHFGSMLLEVLSQRKFFLMGISYLLVGFATLIPYTFVTTFAIEELGISYTSAARLVTVIAASSLLGKVVLGAMSKMLGNMNAILISHIVVVIAMFGIGFSSKLLPLQFFVGVFGFGQGAIWALYASSASEILGNDRTGSVLGTWTLLLCIGFLLSPVIAGLVADRWGTFIFSFWLGIITTLVSSGLLIFARG